jgi:hypothetical protein
LQDQHDCDAQEDAERLLDNVRRNRILLCV